MLLSWKFNQCYGGVCGSASRAFMLRCHREASARKRMVGWDASALERAPCAFTRIGGGLSGLGGQVAGADMGLGVWASPTALSTVLV